MKDNANLVVHGTKVLLVPYRREHVPLYHDWMQDELLQQQTASEPLTMQEELEMQQSWYLDPAKCTFIVLDKSLPDSPGTGRHGGGMAGDVNLFWNDHDDEHTVEIEVMIAEAQSRRRGLAEEALWLLMAYAVSQLHVSTFRAKIGYDNEPSQRLFLKLGYVEIRRVDVFREVHFELNAARCEAAWVRVLELASGLHFGKYDEGDADSYLEQPTPAVTV